MRNAGHGGMDHKHSRDAENGGYGSHKHTRGARHGGMDHIIMHSMVKLLTSFFMQHQIACN